MSRFLRVFAIFFGLIFAGNAFAAGYTCDSLKTYTSCNAGYFMSGTTCTKCGTYSSTDANNTSTSCTCNDGYTTDGAPAGSSNTTTTTAACTAIATTITLNGNGATTAGTTAIYGRYNTQMLFLDSARSQAMASGSGNTITAPSRVHTVAFNRNGGAVTPSSATATYTFKGYYSAKNDGTQYIGTSGYPTSAGYIAGAALKANVTWYAQWTGGSVTLATPTRAGCKFNGWYTASSGGTYVGAAGASYTPTSNITLYAQWTCLDIDVGDKTLTYNGTTTSNGTAQSCANVTASSPSDATVTYSTSSGGTYSATAPTLTNVGSTTVYYKVAKDNYTTKTGNYTCTMGSKAMTVSASNKSKVYDGSALTCSITVTTPTSGATIKYGTASGTYNLTSAPTQTNVGSQTVYYQVTGDNFTTKTGSFTCSVTTATGSTVLKDGSTVVTNGSGSTAFPGTKTLTATCAGGATISSVTSATTSVATVSNSGNTITLTPKATGSSKITVNCPATTNYNASSATYTWTVNPGTISATVKNNSQTYNGSALTCDGDITGLTPSGATVQYATQSSGTCGSYGSAPTRTAAGTTTVCYKISAANYTDKTGTFTCTVNKAANPISLSATSGSTTYPSTTSFTFSGAQGTVTATSANTNAATVAISGTTVTITPKKGDNSTVKITVNADGNSNYNAGTKEYTVTLKPGTISATVNNNSQTYNGSALTCDGDITGLTPSGATVQYATQSSGTCGSYGSAPTRTTAGTTTVCYKISAANYTDKTGTFTCTVNKANNPITIGGKVSATGTVTFPSGATATVSNASGGTLSVTTSDSSIATASVGSTTATSTTLTITAKAKGTATITVTSAATTNYKAGSATYAITINPGTISATVNNNSQTYNGSALTCDGDITGLTPSGATVQYATQSSGTCGSYGSAPTRTTAGTTTVCYKISAANYTDKTGTFTCTVTKAANTLTLSATSGSVDYGATKTFTVSKNTSGGTLTVASDDTASATASISGTTVTVTGVGYGTDGSAKITVTSAATANYNAATATYTVTVNTGKITLNNSSATSAGTTTIYTKYNTNVYLDSARANAMTTSANGITIPAKTNQVFLGYYSAASGGTQYISANGKITSAGLTAGKALKVNGTWYAQWAACACTKGTNVSACDVTGVSSNACTYSYTCNTGYHTSGTFTGTTATATNTSPSCSANAFTVVFNSNKPSTASTTISGTMSNQAFTYDVAQALTANAFSLPGYTFAGWATSASGSVVHADKKSVSNLTATNNGTVTLYAKWTANTITLDWNENSGASVTNGSCTYDSTFSVPAATTRTGYTFAGWKLKDGTVKAASATGVACTNANTGVYSGTSTAITAQWNANTYTILYALNSGTHGTTHPDTATFDTAFTVSNPTRTGYTFAGWKITGMDSVTHTYGSSTTTATSISSTTATSFKNLRSTSGTVTFTAQWNTVSYSITYYDGSTKITTLTPTSYNIETTTFSLPTAYKSGNKFVSWHTDSGLTSSAVTQVTKGTTGNKTYYVKWSTCPAGSVCNGSSVTTCPAGSYCPEGSTSATKCPGDMTSAAGSDAKTDCKITCTAGNYLAAGGSTCSTCTKGNYCANDGTYNFNASSNQGIAACSGTNQWQADTGQTSCDSVTDGMYKSNNYTLQNCGNAYYCKSGARTACTTATGWTTATTSTTASAYTACYQTQTPSGCASGTIKRTASSISGTTITYGTASVSSALSANKNYYVSGTSCPVCTDLGAFYTTSAGGAIGSGSCYGTTDAGKYIATENTSTQTTCPAGSYCPATNVYYGKYGTSSGGQNLCPAGTANANTGSSAASACVTCEAGTYNTTTGNTTCSTCPAGSYCTGGSNKSACTANSSSAAGSDAISDCSCKAGYSGNAGTSGGTCTACACGYYKGSAGNTSCTKTSAGYYATGTGNTGQTKATAGNYAAAGACSQSACAAPYSSSAAGSDDTNDCYLTTSATKYVAEAGKGEVTCAAGGYCPGGSTIYRGGTVTGRATTGGRTACGAGTKNANTGSSASSACTSCAAGTYSTGGASSCSTITDGCYGGAGSVKACPNSCSALNAFYTKSDSGRDTNADCYGTTAATKYVAEAGKGQVACTGGYCPGGTKVYYATGNGSTTGGRNTLSNWTCPDSSDAAADCYRGVTLNKNNMSGTLALPSSSGCRSIGGATGTTADTVYVYYGVACKLPTTALSGSATGTTYTGTTTWATSANAASGFVSSITLTDTSSTTPVRYAGKKYTCSGGYYLKASTNGACTACPDASYCLGISDKYYSTSTQGLSACSALDSTKTDGTYSSVSPRSANTHCRFTQNQQTVPTYCQTKTSNTMSYGGTAWPANTYKVTAKPGSIIVNNNTSSASCSQCSGAVFSGGGTATSCTACPAQTSGWSRGTGTGWDSYADCYQTKAATSVSSYCESGQLKQIGASATTWATATVSTTFKADAGAYVTGSGASTSCSQCTANYYCPGGTTTRQACSSLSGVSVSGGSYTSAAGSDASTDCKYTAPAPEVPTYCATKTSNTVTYSGTAWPTSTYSVTAKAGSIISGNNTATATCSQCTGATYSAGGTATGCSSCDTNYQANTTAGKSLATQCQISCGAGQAVLEKNKACATVTGNNYKTGTALVNYGSTSPTASDKTSGWAADTIYACPSSYSISGTAAGNHDARTDCTISCAKGTRVVSANAACTTPSGTTWYTAAHSVSAGLTSGSNVKSCNTGYATANTTTATDHDEAADCKIGCSAGYYIPTAGEGCKVCTAGKYCSAISGIAQTSTSAVTGNVTAGYWNNGGGTNATGSVISGYSGGTIAAGYYGGAGATSSTGSGTVSGGYYSTGGGTSAKPTSAGTGCLSSFKCGKLSAAYYSNGGSTADGATCVSGKTCGTCDSNYRANTATGKTAVTQCETQCAAGTAVLTANNACATIQNSTYKGKYTAQHNVAYGSKSDISTCPTYYQDGNGAAGQANCINSCAAGTQVASANADCTTPNTTNWYTDVHNVTYGKTSANLSKVIACDSDYANSGTTAANHAGVTSCKVTCAAGTYVASSGAACTDVGSGYYRSGTETVSQTKTGTRNACTALGAIYKASDAGRDASTDCYATTTAKSYVKTAKDATETSCPAGSYCPGSVKVYYNSTGGSTLCPAGKFCVAGVSAGTECVLGSYSAAGASACTACQDGKTTSAKGATSCNATCSNATGVSDWETASWATTNTMTNLCTIAATAGCSANYYKNSNACSTCSSGTNSKYTLSAAGTTSVNSCYLKTTEGKYVATKGAGETACISPYYCPGGTTIYYGTGTTTGGNSTCTGLGAIYKASDAGASKNTQCYATTSAGKYVTAKATSEAACPAGDWCAGSVKVYYGSAGGNTDCPSGYTSGTTGYSAQSQCLMSVAGGKYVATEKESSASGTCAAGYYKPAHTVNYGGTSSCSACTGATYQPSTGQASCLSCPAATNDTANVSSYSYWNGGSTGDHTVRSGCYVIFKSKTLDDGVMTSYACYVDTGADTYGVDGTSRSCLVNRSALTCNGGYYNSTFNNSSTATQYTSNKTLTDLYANVCQAVGTGYYSANDALTRTACSTGLVTCGSGACANEADDCGRKLHMGANTIYLRSAKRGTPALNVKIGDKTFYGVLSTSLSSKAKVKNGTTTYSVVNDNQ